MKTKTEKEIIEKVLGKYRWVDEEIPLQEIIEKALKFQKEEFNKKVEEFVRRIIRRCCTPNKPINTFEYAREIKEISAKRNEFKLQTPI